MAMSIFRLLWLTRIPRLVTRLMLDRRVPLRLKLIIPASILYLVLPFDLLPDLVPLVGHSDDLIVVILALAAFLVMTPHGIILEHLRGRSPGGVPTDADADRPGATVIEGRYRHVEDESERSS